MKFIHIQDLPKETTHEGTLLVNRIVSVGQSKTKLQTVNRATLPPGKSMAPHKHDDCEEIFYFLDGSGQVIAGGKTVPVSHDDVVIVEPGEDHKIKNTSFSNLVYLSVRILL
jgi:mannose-6-phosphate isomerase-like protein (cupin superfamily)